VLGVKRKKKIWEKPRRGDRKLGAKGGRSGVFCEPEHSKGESIKRKRGHGGTGDREVRTLIIADGRGETEHRWGKWGVVFLGG